MTDCQLGVINPRLLNPEKKKATRRLLFDRTIASGLQAKMAFNSSADNDTLNILTSLMAAARWAICSSVSIESNGFSVSAMGGAVIEADFCEDSDMDISLCRK